MERQLSGAPALGHSEKRVKRKAKAAVKKKVEEHRPIPIPKTEQDLAEGRDRDEFWARTVTMRA